MSAITPLTRFISVRHGFTEQCVWRPALGGYEPLRVAVTDGPLDAPDWMPAGSMQFNDSIYRKPFVFSTSINREGGLA